MYSIFRLTRYGWFGIGALVLLGGGILGVVLWMSSATPSRRSADSQRAIANQFLTLLTSRDIAAAAKLTCDPRIDIAERAIQGDIDRGLPGAFVPLPDVITYPTGQVDLAYRMHRGTTELIGSVVVQATADRGQYCVVSLVENSSYR